MSCRVGWGFEALCIARSSHTADSGQLLTSGGCRQRDVAKQWQDAEEVHPAATSPHRYVATLSWRRQKAAVTATSNMTVRWRRFAVRWGMFSFVL